MAVMTSPGLVRRSRNATKRRSRLPFHWRASDVVELGLDALSGQDATFTRPSAGGLVIDRNGRLIGPHANTLPRYQMHDLDGGGVRGTPALLLEGQRTNDWTRSEALDNAAWTKSNCSISADATTAPDKASTADKIVEDGSTSIHLVRRFAPTLTDDTLTAVSFFAKAAGRTVINCNTNNKAGAGGSTDFDLSAGTVGSNSHDAARITALADGWYRCEVAFDSGSGGGSPRVDFRLTDGGTQSYAGDGSSGTYVWGVQIEVDQSVGSSYIKTEGSTVTRSAELLQYGIGWSPADITRHGGLTVLSEFVEMGTAFSGANGTRYWHIGGSGATDTPLLQLEYRDAVERVRAVWNGGSGNVTSEVNRHSMFDHVSARMVVFLDGSDWKIQLHVSVNGGAETSGAAGTIGASLGAVSWSAGTLTLNAAPNSSNHGLAGHISHKFAFGNRTLAQMQGAF